MHAGTQTPAHTAPSWGKGGPADLLCGESALRVDRNETYTFLSQLFSEVASVFPGAIFHAGGDEVGYGCWAGTPAVQEFMHGE